MSLAKKVQYHNIPLVIDGKTKTVKGVTKFTTCDEVINKLPASPGDHLAVFKVTSGVEKELGGKTKLLKVWRSKGSSKKVRFIVKKSEGVKARRLSLNIFGGRNSRKSVGPADISTSKLKQVSDLAFYVQYQKSKLQKMTNPEECSDRGNMQKVKSTSSIDSMDAFLVKADHQKMGQFLDFCSGVTSRHLGGAPNVITEKTPEKSRTRVSRTVIKESLRTMKLGFKRTLTSKLSFASKTTSASTLKSTDTGFQSQASDMRSETSNEVKRPFNGSSENPNNAPFHSTPVTHLFKRGVKRETLDDTLEVTLTTPKAPKFDEEAGKSVLMRRFMEDTTICEANKRELETSKNLQQRKDICASAPVLFRSQEEKCRFYWNQNSDTDNESSCSDDSCFAATDLNEAFVEHSDDIHVFSGFSDPTPRKLRRESALSNLNMFEICAIPFEDTCADHELEDNGFSYSFNCSFPEFSDSQDFSIDYSCSDTSESDLSSCFEENYFRNVKDEDVYRFMASRESLVIKGAVDHDEKVSEVGSDEGLGSMASDSFSDDKELFV